MTSSLGAASFQLNSQMPVQVSLEKKLLCFPSSTPLFQRRETVTVQGLDSAHHGRDKKPTFPWAPERIRWQKDSNPPKQKQDDLPKWLCTSQPHAPVSGVAHLACFHVLGFPEGLQGYWLGLPDKRMRPGESLLLFQCRFLWDPYLKRNYPKEKIESKTLEGLKQQSANYYSQGNDMNLIKLLTNTHGQWKLIYEWWRTSETTCRGLSRIMRLGESGGK